MPTSRSPLVRAGLDSARLLSVLLLLLASPPARSQDCADADPVLAEDFEEHVDILSSDAFEGRGTGTVGERRAAAYITGILEELGLQPAGDDGTWFQSFPVPQSGAARRAERARRERLRSEADGPEPAPPAAEHEGTSDDHPHADDASARDEAASDAAGETLDAELGLLGADEPVYDFPDGRNILALLPGSDPQLARQIVVLGAHYDHVGKKGDHGGSLGGHGEIHNGADDNASGSALLLEIATYLVSCPEKPRRSILFQWYSGEELGLVGSSYWVAHPTRPLDDVVAMLNTDMVGRLLGGTVLVGGVGTSPGFSDMARDLGAREKLHVLLDPVGGAPSDSLEFYAHQIPVLFLFTGIHADYHTSHDDAYKINAPGAERVMRLALRMLLALADADEPPPFTPAPGMSDYWTPHVVYGMSLDPAPAGSGAAARAAVVVPDGPAGRAGLLEGDLLLSVDGRAAADVPALLALLGAVDDDRTPKSVEILRPSAGGGEGRHLRLMMQPDVR